MTNKIAKKILKMEKDKLMAKPESDRDWELITALDIAIRNLKPQGKWIKWDFKTFGASGDWDYKCSYCGIVFGGAYNYCPNCGAKMEKKEADNEINN